MDAVSLSNRPKARAKAEAAAEAEDLAVAVEAHAAVAVQEAATKVAVAIKANAKEASAVVQPTDVTAKNPGDARHPTVTHARKDTNYTIYKCLKGGVLSSALSI